MSRLAFSAALVAVLAVFVSGSEWGGVSAQTIPAPDVAANDARCYRSIAETDDLLCLLRYELPQQTTPFPTPIPGTPEAWCYWLTDRTGCGDDPVAPENPTSLEPDRAYLTLCQLSGAEDGCVTDTGTLIFQDRVPRIWHGLAGVYLSAGHGLTWGDSTLFMCVESSASFVTTSSACAPVVFNGEANTEAAQRAILGTDLVQLVLDLERARFLPINSLVAGNKITTAGRVLALEAYRYMTDVVPSVFQAATIGSNATPFSGTPAGVVVLQTQIAATANAAGFMNPAQRNEALGISGGFSNTLIFAFFGAIAAIIALRLSGSIVLAVVFFGAVSMIGIFVGGPSLSAIAVTIVVLSLLAGWFVLSRAPSG